MARGCRYQRGTRARAHCALHATLHRVRKTSVYLTERESNRLAELARAEGRSQAEIIREAITAYVPAGKGDGDFALAAGFARIDDDPRPISEIPEDKLLNGFGSVTLVLDTAPLVALADEREPLRAEILELLRSERGGLFIPAPVTAEIDYLSTATGGSVSPRCGQCGSVRDRSRLSSSGCGPAG